ncbi:hypothetical protein [Streptomyces sp. NPDC057460]|uniref:hypothetical protein n=1 Tax=Streptomyces sp. NPDC057460 TaxID=3346141 RepID=UPI0036BE6F4C
MALQTTAMESPWGSTVHDPEGELMPILVELGATKSADLPAVLDHETCLIEVKSASGAAPEKLVSHLQRHLETWPLG